MIEPLFDVRGDVVVVTGAARGIGRETVALLARAGAVVVASDIDGELLDSLRYALEQEGVQIHTFVGDVTDERSVNEMIGASASISNRIDSLVNNVGGTDWIPASFELATLEYWREVLRLNLTSQFLCIRAVAPVMRRAGKGRIVNVSSLAGTHGSWRAGAPYCAAKGGVIALTKSMATALGSDGIVVNSVAQSDTLTERTEELFASDFWSESRETMNRRYAHYPLQRPATMLDVARGIAFLCSPGADYITGTTLYVDGGARFGWSLRVVEDDRSAAPA